MMNIPMRTKLPVRLEEMAVSQVRIRRPQALRQVTHAQKEQAPPAQSRQAESVRTARPGQVHPAAPMSQTGLKKGQKVSLTQKNPNPAEIQVSLRWKVENPMCDLDVSAFLLGADGKVPGDAWFVFYGQTESPDGSVIHLGDCRNGREDGEAICIHLKKLNPGVKKIVFILTIHEALERGLNFGMVSHASICVTDGGSGKELAGFELEEYYQNVTSMIVGEIYERNAEWKFNAVGNGVARDLAGLCEMYGVEVADE